MNIPFLVISSLFFLVGFWGLLIPVIPDLPLVWLGVFIYALATRFADLSLATVLLLGALSLSTYLIDYLSTTLGAKRYGASRQGIIGAIIGGLIGIFFTPVGFILGALAGTILAELWIGRTFDEAKKASKGALLGMLIGLFAKIIIAGVIIGVFLKSVL